MKPVLHQISRTMETLLADYDVLSKRINTYLQWVEENFDPGYRLEEPALTDMEISF